MGSFFSVELTFDRLANGEWVLDARQGENSKIALMLFKSLVPYFLSVERQAAHNANPETSRFKQVVIQLKELEQDQQSLGEHSRATVALLTPFLVPLFCKSNLLVKDLRVLQKFANEERIHHRESAVGNEDPSSSSTAGSGMNYAKFNSNNINNKHQSGTKTNDASSLIHRLIILSDVNMAVSRMSTHLAFAASTSPLQRKATAATMRRVEQSRSLWMEQHPAAPLLLFAPGLLPEVDDGAPPSLASVYALADGPPTQRTGTSSFWNIHSMMCHILLSVAVSTWSTSSSSSSSSSATAAGGSSSSSSSSSRGATAADRLMKLDNTHTFEDLIAAAVGNEKSMTIVAEAVIDILNGFLRGQPDGRRFERGRDSLAAAINHFCGTKFLRGAASQPDFVNPVLRHEWNFSNLRSMFMCSSVPLSSGAVAGNNNDDDDDDDEDDNENNFARRNRANNQDGDDEDNQEELKKEEDPALLFGLNFPSAKRRFVIPTISSSNNTSRSSYGSARNANNNNNQLQSDDPVTNMMMMMNNNNNSNNNVVPGSVASFTAPRSISDLLNTSVAKVLKEIKSAFAVRRINAELIKKKKEQFAVAASTTKKRSPGANEDDNDDDENESIFENGNNKQRRSSHQPHFNNDDDEDDEFDDFDIISEESAVDEQRENAAFHDNALLSPHGSIAIHPRHILQRATMHGKENAVKRLIREVHRISQEDNYGRSPAYGSFHQNQNQNLQQQQHYSPTSTLNAQDLQLSNQIRLEEWRHRLSARKTIDRSQWALLCVDSQDNDPVTDLDGEQQKERQMMASSGAHHHGHHHSASSKDPAVATRRFLTALVFERKQKMIAATNSTLRERRKKRKSSRSNKKKKRNQTNNSSPTDDTTGTSAANLVETPVRQKRARFNDDDDNTNRNRRSPVIHSDDNSSNDDDDSENEDDDDNPLFQQYYSSPTSSSSSTDDLLLIQAALRAAFLIVMDDLGAAMTVSKLEQHQHQDSSSSLTTTPNKTTSPTTAAAPATNFPQKQLESSFSDNNQNSKSTTTTIISTSSSLIRAVQSALDQFSIKRQTALAQRLKQSAALVANTTKDRQRLFYEKQLNHQLRAVWQGTASDFVANALDQLMVTYFGSGAHSSSSAGVLGDEQDLHPNQLVNLAGTTSGRSSGGSSSSHNNLVWTEIQIAVEKSASDSTYHHHNNEHQSSPSNTKQQQVYETYKLFVKLPPPQSALFTSSSSSSSYCDLLDLATWFIQVSSFTPHSSLHELEHVFLNAPSLQQALSIMMAWHSRNDLERDPELRLLCEDAAANFMPTTDEPVVDERGNLVAGVTFGVEHSPERQREKMLLSSRSSLFSSNNDQENNNNLQQQQQQENNSNSKVVLPFQTNKQNMTSIIMQRILKYHNSNTASSKSSSGSAVQGIRHAKPFDVSKSTELVTEMKQQWGVEKNLLAAHIYNEKHALAVERDRRKLDLTSFKRMLKEQPLIAIGNNNNKKNSSSSPNTMDVNSGSFVSPEASFQLDRKQVHNIFSSSGRGGGGEMSMNESGGAATVVEDEDGMFETNEMKRLAEKYDKTRASSARVPVSQKGFAQSTSSSYRKITARPPSSPTSRREKLGEAKNKNNKNPRLSKFSTLVEKKNNQVLTHHQQSEDIFSSAGAPTTTNPLVNLGDQPSNNKNALVTTDASSSMRMMMMTPSSIVGACYSQPSGPMWLKLETVLSRWATATDLEHSHIAHQCQTEQQTRAYKIVSSESQLRRPWPSGGPLNEMLLQQRWRPPRFHSSENEGMIALTTICSLLFWDPSPPPTNSDEKEEEKLLLFEDDSEYESSDNDHDDDDSDDDDEDSNNSDGNNYFKNKNKYRRNSDSMNSKDGSDDDDGNNNNDDEEEEEEVTAKSRLIEAEAHGSISKLAIHVFQQLLWPPTSAGQGSSIIQNTWADALQYPVVLQRAMFAVTSLLDVDFTQRHSQRRVWKVGLHLALLRFLADRDQSHDIKASVCRLLITIANDRMNAGILHEFGIEHVICRELFSFAWFAFKPPSAAATWNVSQDVIQYTIQLLLLAASVMSIVESSAERWMDILQGGQEVLMYFTPKNAFSSSSSSSAGFSGGGDHHHQHHHHNPSSNNNTCAGTKITPELLGQLLSNILRFVRRSTDEFVIACTNGIRKRQRQYSTEFGPKELSGSSSRPSSSSSAARRRRGKDGTANSNKKKSSSSSKNINNPFSPNNKNTKTNAALSSAVLFFSMMLGMRRTAEGEKPHLARKLFGAPPPKLLLKRKTSTANLMGLTTATASNGENNNNSQGNHALVTNSARFDASSSHHHQQQQQPSSRFHVTSNSSVQSIIPPQKKEVTMGFSALVESAWELTKKTGKLRFVNKFIAQQKQQRGSSNSNSNQKRSSSRKRYRHHHESTPTTIATTVSWDDAVEAATMTLQALGTMAVIGDAFPRLESEETAARLFGTLLEIVGCFSNAREIHQASAPGQQQQFQQFNQPRGGGGVPTSSNNSNTNTSSNSNSTTIVAEHWTALCSRVEVDRLGAVRVQFISNAHARLYLGSVVALTRLLNGELLFDSSRSDWTAMACTVAEKILPNTMEILAGMLSNITLPSMKAVTDMRRCCFLGSDFPPLSPCPVDSSALGGGKKNFTGDDDDDDQDDDDDDDIDESVSPSSTAAGSLQSYAATSVMLGSAGVGYAQSTIAGNNNNDNNGSNNKKGVSNKEESDPSLVVTFHLSALLAVALRNCSADSRGALARSSAELLVALVDLDSAYFQKWFAAAAASNNNSYSSPSSSSPSGGGGKKSGKVVIQSPSSIVSGDDNTNANAKNSSFGGTKSSGILMASGSAGSTGHTSSSIGPQFRGEAIAATSPVGRLVHGIRENVANALELLAVDPEAAAKLRVNAVPVLLAVLRNTAIAPLASSCAAALVAVASHDAVNFVTNNHDALGTMLSALHRGTTTTSSSSASTSKHSASSSYLSKVSFLTPAQQREQKEKDFVDDTTFTMLSAAVSFLSAVLRSRATQASTHSRLAYDSIAMQVDNMLLGHIGRIPHFLSLNGVSRIANTEASCNLIGETSVLSATILLHCPGLRGVLEQDGVISKITRALVDGLLPKLLFIPSSSFSRNRSPSSFMMMGSSTARPSSASRRSISGSSTRTNSPGERKRRPSAVLFGGNASTTSDFAAASFLANPSQAMETSKAERARLDQARRLAASKCIMAIDEASRLNPDVVTKSKDLSKMLDVVALLLSGESTIPDPRLYVQNKNIASSSNTTGSSSSSSSSSKVLLLQTDIALRTLSFANRLLQMESLGNSTVNSDGREIVDGLLVRNVTPHIVGLLAHQSVAVQELAGQVMKSLRTIHNSEPKPQKFRFDQHI